MELHVDLLCGLVVVECGGRDQVYLDSSAWRRFRVKSLSWPRRSSVRRPCRCSALVRCPCACAARDGHDDPWPFSYDALGKCHSAEARGHRVFRVLYLDRRFTQDDASNQACQGGSDTLFRLLSCIPSTNREHGQRSGSVWFGVFM